MKSVVYRIWFGLIFTFAIAFGVTRMVWQAFAPNPSVGALTLIILAIVALLIGYAAVIYFTVTLNFSRLGSTAFRLLATVTLVSVVGAGILHYYRFLISLRHDQPLEAALATLVLLSTMGLDLMVLSIVWRKRNSPAEKV